MGRAAKHFTQAEKQAAKRSHQHQTAQNPRFRQLRKLQNQRAYQRRLETQPAISSAAFEIPVLPSKILTGSTYVLPRSRTYTIVRESGDFFTDSDLSDDNLARYDCRPPYPPPREDTSINYLEDAICGRRMRLLYEAETKRLDCYNVMSCGEFFSLLHQELLECLHEWEETRLALEGLISQSIDHRLGEEWEEWLAKRLTDLKDDLYAVKVGNDLFMKLYIERWS